MPDSVSAVPQGVPEHDAQPTRRAKRLLVWEREQRPIGRIQFRAERSGARIDSVAVFVPMDGEFELNQCYALCLGFVVVFEWILSVVSAGVGEGQSK